MTTENILTIWLSSWPSPVYNDITSYITGGTKPTYGDLNESSVQQKFNVSFNDKYYNDLIEIKTGDDIVITTNPAATQVMELKLAGKVCTLEKIHNAWFETPVNGRKVPLRTSQCTVEQRDFTTKPFDLIYQKVTSLTTVLNFNFQEHRRPELGGVMPSGLVIPPYVLLTADIDIFPIELRGLGSMGNLKEIASKNNLEWDIISYVELYEPTGIKKIDQVRVWQ